MPGTHAKTLLKCHCRSPWPSLAASDPMK